MWNSKTIRVIQESPDILPKIKYAMCLYLGYQIEVWEILRNPCTKQEEYCKNQVIKILAYRGLSRNKQKQLWKQI
jgi:hypothetical protein